MLVLQFLLALGLAMLAHARMSTEFVTHAVDVFEIMDFLVFNVPPPESPTALSPVCSLS